MRRATEPRYSNPEAQAFVERLAHGKCSAVSRPVSLKRRYFPTIAGEVIPDAKHPDGFDTNHDAVKRAQELREVARLELAETEGSI